MKFLLDECLPKSSRDVLRLLMYDFIDVKEIGLLGESDDVILNYAKKKNRILITVDKDFSNIYKYKPGSYPGIIIIRSEYPATSTKINILLHKFLKKAKSLKIDEALVVVSKNKIRIRR